VNDREEDGRGDREGREDRDQADPNPADPAGRGEFADRVYQPAEDSELLANAACEAIEPDDRVLDVGTGSGYIATRASETGARVVGADRNPHACRQARRNGIEVVRMDLASAFGGETFDVVLFNPPYLPTEPNSEFDEASDDWMAVALSGGETGRAVIEPFINGVGRVLRPDGFALVLASSLAGLEAIETRVHEASFESEEVAEESHFFERLVVLKLLATEAAPNR
jgi:release factor glutamine methyltransferase